ncbi:MAG: ribosome assembly cofactor RimP [Paludibacteraceae bacterium]|nr:ribosome assembly cofactor RimP [Paludibacteraceae bacterium]
MIDKKQVEEIVREFIVSSEVELINLVVTPDNHIQVDIDSYQGVDIDTCVALSNFIEDRLSRDVEDYELQVGGVSITDPFKTIMQYKKHLGHEVIVLTGEGVRLTGELVEVNDNDFSVDVVEMVKQEGAKRRHRQVVTKTFNYTEVKSVCYNLKV